MRMCETVRGKATKYCAADEPVVDYCAVAIDPYNKNRRTEENEINIVRKKEKINSTIHKCTEILKTWSENRIIVFKKYRKLTEIFKNREKFPAFTHQR